MIPATVLRISCSRSLPSRPTASAASRRRVRSEVRCCCWASRSRSREKETLRKKQAPTSWPIATAPSVQGLWKTGVCARLAEPSMRKRVRTRGVVQPQATGCRRRTTTTSTWIEVTAAVRTFSASGERSSGAAPATARRARATVPPSDRPSTSGSGVREARVPATTRTRTTSADTRLRTSSQPGREVSSVGSTTPERGTVSAWVQANSAAAAHQPCVTVGATRQLT